jgi:hypothetical protein
VESQDRRGDLILASAGGVAAAVIGFAGMAVVGSASAFQARRLLESALPTVRFAAAAYIGGGATVLALMLTLLTFSISHDLDFRPTHYGRIRDIAALSAAVIVASVVLLMFLSFPIGEAEVDRGWFYAVRGLIEVALDPASSSLVDTD